MSYPSLFKHLAFDGGFLHGVPEQLIRTGHQRVRESGEGSGQPKGQPEGGSTTDHSSAASIPSSCATVSAPRTTRAVDGLPENQAITRKPHSVHTTVVRAALLRRHFPDVSPRMKCGLWLKWFCLRGVDSAVRGIRHPPSAVCMCCSSRVFLLRRILFIITFLLPLSFYRWFFFLVWFYARRSQLRRRRGRMRVTLLVNIWLSHKPKGISPLPASIAASLSGGGPSAPLSLRFDRPFTFSPVSVNDRKDTQLPRQEQAGVSEPRGSTMLIKAPLGPSLFLELRTPTPQRLSMGDLKWLNSFALVYRESGFPRIKTLSEDKAGTAACAHGPKHSGGSACMSDASAEPGHARYCPVKGVTEGLNGDNALGRTPRKRKHDTNV